MVIPVKPVHHFWQHDVIESGMMRSRQQLNSIAQEMRIKLKEHSH